MTYKKMKIKSPIPFSGNKFSGILLEPIYTKFFPKAKSTGESLYEEIETLRTKILEKANHELVKRIFALIEHYEIEDAEVDQMFAALAFKLAKDFIPGCQHNYFPPETRKRGEYPVGGPLLIDAVNECVTKKGCTVKDACIHLTRHNKRWENHKHRALETAYYRAIEAVKKSYAEIESLKETDPLFKRAFELLGFEGMLAQMGDDPWKKATK